MFISYDEVFGGFSIFIILLIIFIIVAVAAFIIPLVVFSLMGRYKMFKKAGKNGWEVFIPFYSEWTLCEIAGLDYYWCIFIYASSIVSILESVSSTTGSVIFGLIAFPAGMLAILANVAIAFNLKEKFHKDKNWIVLACLLGGIMIPLLGYTDKDKYDENAVVSKNSFFEPKK